LQSTDRKRAGADEAPAPESLQALERVLVAVRYGDAARLRAARHGGVEDLLSVGRQATRPGSFAGNDPQH
jgi:hypothetical protein